MTHVVVCVGVVRAGRGGVGGGRPAALSVGQLVSLCTALSFLPWRLLLRMRMCLHSLNNKVASSMWGCGPSLTILFLTLISSLVPLVRKPSRISSSFCDSKRIWLQLLSGPTIHVPWWSESTMLSSRIFLASPCYSKAQHRHQKQGQHLWWYGLQASNVTVKVCVITKNHGTVNF